MGRDLQRADQSIVCPVEQLQNLNTHFAWNLQLKLCVSVLAGAVNIE